MAEPSTAKKYKASKLKTMGITRYRDMHSLNSVKNKILRNELYRKEKMLRMKEKRQLRIQRKKDAKSMGDKAPKPVQKTIENTREPDPTTVQEEDEEVMEDETTDEMAPYFNRLTTPKILILSVTKPSNRTHLLMRELSTCIPNAEVRDRRKVDLKKIVAQATERDFSDMIVVNEDRKEPNGLLLVHLPNGPTAHFKVTNFRRGRDIRGHGRSTSHLPEVILNNFTTRLGHTVGRMFAALFPHDPQFKGRRAVTFHNQRDFIFFRHYRYIFKNAKKVGLQEIGPRFTLKLRSLQKGTFDSKFGEYIWIHNRKQMDTSRRRFHL
jgi:ribosome production factor 1